MELGLKLDRTEQSRFSFFDARLDSLFKGSWDTDIRQRGINQVHNIGPNGRENFLKQAVRNAFMGAVRRPQFL